MNLTESYKTKQDEYYTSMRPEVQGWVRKNQNAILDVGCGSGEMAYELKTNKNIKEVWGIEPVEKFGAQAKLKLDNTLIMPVEEAVGLLPDNKFDTIIFADVLEHLVDPDDILTRLKPKLSFNGEIIASIPNIRHWSIFYRLLEGDWQYSDYGLLDKTHLRFFTKKSIERMFRTAGYYPQFLGSQKIGNVVIGDDLIELLSNAGIKAVNLNEELNDLQYFVRASLGYDALIIPSRFINQSLLNKISSLSPELKRNIKIAVIYKVNSPIVEFIKSLNDPQESMIAVNVDEIKFDNYKRVIFINNSGFSFSNLERDFNEFSGEVICREDYTIAMNNTPEFSRLADKIKQIEIQPGTEQFRIR